MNISAHITFEEATISPTALRLGIDNNPNNLQLANMERVAEKCFEPLRNWYGKPIKVNSFFRSEKLNKAVKGSKSSQHCTGEAIDISAGSKEENKKLFDWCKANLQFDQLIWEYGNDSGPDWVHISYKLTGNRNMTLIIT
jgi:hypothetical protein